MKTAMQSFWDKIALDLSIEQINKFIPEFEQAKAMEKEQIENSFADGFVEGIEAQKSGEQILFPELYYNETYGKQEKL